ncbi:hypothetical protein V500_00960 [Pseudogymnoascus sp. VKM F-4518 (FW-2643)]|nr:hypothetical protein V500_00960 [Pseudogymnoascus sp. VKM F-4518 (FW-2643)]
MSTQTPQRTTPRSAPREEPSPSAAIRHDRRAGKEHHREADPEARSLNGEIGEILSPVLDDWHAEAVRVDYFAAEEGGDDAAGADGD